ncbi:MAG: hypothetical protein M1819_003508 [Sarea resinae]|nr:MAG: hypothetical protein M1819_003508 [Sarea resinae]
MFGAFRQASASVPRALRSTSTCSFRSSTIKSLASPFIARSPALSASRQLHQSCAWRQAKLDNGAIKAEIEREVNAERPPTGQEIQEKTQQGPITRFAELQERGLVHENIVKCLTLDMKLTTMTQVQSMTINEALSGTDVLAQARTGTGKTIGFLLPVLQNILSKDPSLVRRKGFRDGKATPSDIRALIISPTRELAEQIAQEARRLCFHTGVIVQTAVGGTQKSQGLRTMQRQGCHILIGTPGRLNDILSDPHTGVKAPKLSAFVLDEADRLLDDGFLPAIKDIQKLLPNRREVDRQTLLFSATVPEDVMPVVRATMKPTFHTVRTVQAGEQPTHTKVPQKLVHVQGLENILPACLEICKRGKEEQEAFKAIVFCNSTADVALAAGVFQNLRAPGAALFSRHPLYPTKIIEIHARLSQKARTDAATAFRNAESAIMFSSDVTARGMDFPGVTHVIQLGVPGTRDSYIHRVGRTARGSNTGEAWLLTPAFERSVLSRRLSGLPLELPDASSDLQTAKLDLSQPAHLPAATGETLTQIQEATKLVDRQVKAKAYLSYLGIYQAISHKQMVVDAVNSLARYGWGMETPPKVSHGIARKLGLDRMRGLVFGHEDEEEGRGGRRSDSARGVSRFGGEGRRFDRSDRQSSSSRPSYGDRRGRDFGGSSDRSSYGGRSFERKRDFDTQESSGSSGRDFAPRERRGGFERRRDFDTQETSGSGRDFAPRERRGHEGRRREGGEGGGFKRFGGFRGTREEADSY